MYDVAIVGGGPAGCAAAITLVRAGRSVILLERSRGSPDGFCGEFLSPDGVGSLALLGSLERILTFEPPLVSHWRLDTCAHQIQGDLPGPALGISRQALDPTLRGLARDSGVEVREGTRVRSVVELPGTGFDVRCGDGESLPARHVVGATGRSTRIPGISPETPVGPREFVAFKAHFRTREMPTAIRLFALGGAYVGVGPVDGERVNVCYLARRELFEATGSTPRGILDRTAASHPAWESCWRGLTRTSGRWLSTGGLFFRPRSIATAVGVTLCGDAAGLISPFLGEGMSMALEGGCLAGELVDRHLEEPAVLAASYPSIWRKRFGARMRWGERLQRVLLAANPDTALRWLRFVPALGDVIARRSRSTELTLQGRRALAMIRP